VAKVINRYHDQRTCLLDGTLVTITTFDRESDGDGPGWVLADSLNLTAQPGETAVMRLHQSATHRIPSAA
jgi:hypothetical protein